MSLTAFALNCSLKPSSESSSTEKLIDEVLFALKDHGVSGAGTGRLADQVILPGVTSDEGPGDDWPALRHQILDADIFVPGTPIWMGHPSSYAPRVLERLNAFLGELDDEGRMVTIPANGLTYWVGEAMQSTDYKDLPRGSEKTHTATKLAASNAAHLAGLLAEQPYPPT